ncbi:unnamed protein product [Gadus morhua 'NCC']
MAKSEKPHDLYLTCNEHSLLDQLCSCTAGSPGFCSHIVGLMYTLDLCRARHNDISSTSQPQQWHKARPKSTASGNPSCPAISTITATCLPSWRVFC